MPKPELRRASDGFLISDRCISWTDWGEASGIQENELLVGGIYHMEQLGNEQENSEAVFLFADDRASSNLAKLEVLKQCRRDIVPVTFKDQDGNITTCEIVEDIGVEPRGNRLRRRNLASVVLRPAGSI